MLNDFIDEALQQAHRAVKEKSGGPFGAVIVCNNQIIGRGFNTVIRDNDPTAHAEMNAIRNAAGKLKNADLSNCFLVTTSEPCPMCLMAARWARLLKIYYIAPCSLASHYGFQDEELYKSIREAGIEMVELNEFHQQVEDVFKLWKEEGGRLY